MVAQKIKASASNKGFTLVELIVVITILAILGTIGFISIQGYSAQSRDSKRTSDLRSLASAITIKTVDGMDLTSFVTSVPSNKLTAGNLSGTGLSGAPITEYNAGSPNFTALGVNPDNFKDGAYNYVIGTTSRGGSAFQIAAKLEWNGTPNTLLTGNYSPRTATAMSGTVALWSGSGFTVSNLTGTGVGFFRKGDYVFVGTKVGKIDTVAGDGKWFAATALAAVPTAGTITDLILGTLIGGSSDVSGLVASSNTTEAVANGSTTLLPY